MRQMPHWFPIVALSVGILSGVIFARPAAEMLSQAPTPGGNALPTFRATVRAVVMDVSVLDGDRRPVRGLKATDFTCRFGERAGARRTVARVFAIAQAPADRRRFLQGKSLRPLLDNATARWEKPAVSQTNRSAPPAGRGGERGGEGVPALPAGSKPIVGYSLRTERYRYSQWVQDGGVAGEELYDYQADSRELRNMANDASARDIEARLRRQLDEIRGSRPPVAAARS